MISKADSKTERGTQSTPRYQRIAGEPTAQIRDGAFTFGAMPPPENEVSDRYRVSRCTVREALRQLEVSPSHHPAPRFTHRLTVRRRPANGEGA